MSIDVGERVDIVAQQSEFSANDADPKIFEHVSNDMASRARARKHLQQRIVSLFSALEPRIVPYTLEEILVTPLSASTPLKSLLTQLNDLAPIHILPSELLLAIISRRAFGSSQKRRRELAKLGAVCTSWRSLTLSSPRLWQHIDLRLTAYAALAVRRSQDIPVHIAFRVLDDESRSPGPEDYRTISDLAPRIASMKFSLPIDLYPELLDNFPLSLPLLHELGLSTVARENYIYTGTLPLGSASTLTLRVLNLSGVWLPWTLPLYRELVHLHVRLYHGAPISLSLQTFRDVLSGCPQLASLKLYGVPFEAGTELSAVSAAPPISLSRLRNLDLRIWKVSSSLCHHAALVMGTIAAIPPAASLCIMCTTDKDRLEFSSSGTNSGTLSMFNGRGYRTDPDMHYLLDRLPRVCSLLVRWKGHVETKSFLRLMLNGLDMRRMETLTTRGVPVSLLAEVLKNKGVGALKSLRVEHLPDDEISWDVESSDEPESDPQEITRYAEEAGRSAALLKELVAEVQVPVDPV